MTLDIHWTLTVNVPQLDTLEQTLRRIGDALVDTQQAIRDEFARLNEGQAAIGQANADALNGILAEMEQWNAGSVTQAQLDNVLAAVKVAADTAEKQAADIRANTALITQIVPDDAAPPA